MQFLVSFSYYRIFEKGSKWVVIKHNKYDLSKKVFPCFCRLLIYCSFHLSFPVLPVFFRCVARKVSNFMFLKLFIFNESFRFFSNVIRCSTEKNKHSLAFGFFVLRSQYFCYRYFSYHEQFHSSGCCSIFFLDIFLTFWPFFIQL